MVPLATTHVNPSHCRTLNPFIEGGSTILQYGTGVLLVAENTHAKKGEREEREKPHLSQSWKLSRREIEMMEKREFETLKG